MEEKWYRVDDTRQSVADEFGDHAYSIIAVTLSEYPVEKHTPKGVWLNIYGWRKFVLKNARKRWACPTKAEAFESFRARKKKQRAILEDRLYKVEEALAKADRLELNR